jgi:hypothetical protein
VLIRIAGPVFRPEDIMGLFGSIAANGSGMGGGMGGPPLPPSQGRNGYSERKFVFDCVRGGV